ncbi:glycosyltransferase [Candidatus Saccharibacteria bacterium]|nr:glycosyltransferase [Candidatus Saccharibacteria bacterium]
MSNYILFDNQENYDFLKSDFDGAFYSPKCKKKIISWIKGAYITLRNTKKNDTIVCWYDFQAIILFWMSKIMGQRKIICLNILLKPKTTIKNKLVTILYKCALSAKNFKATVSSHCYGELLNKKFKKSFDYILLRDVYRDCYQLKCDKVQMIPKTVFCGGRNGRDWNFLFSLASQMPDVSFRAIMSQNDYKYYQNVITENVTVMVDVSYEKFCEVIFQSQIVALPLDTEAPAGLIVFFQAIANERPFIISRTAATEGYIFNHEEFFLPNDVFLWKEKIKAIISDYNTWNFKIKEMKNIIEEECNEQKFKKKIKEIVNE